MKGKPQRISARLSAKHTSPTPTKNPAKKEEKISKGQKGKTGVVKDLENSKHNRDAKTAQAEEAGNAKGSVYTFHNCTSGDCTVRNNILIKVYKISSFCFTFVSYLVGTQSTSLFFRRKGQRIVTEVHQS